jgi:hypothetical protein
MNLKDYYLDLDKVSNLKTEDERQNIHNYYRDLLASCSENDDKRSESIFNTLEKAGYLCSVEKSDIVLS